VQEELKLKETPQLSV